MSDFEPKILTFSCNWCSYAGADNAGSGRIQYSPSIRILRTMCSGRVGVGLIMKAFAQGLDGVLVTGCHPGDCKYIFGNENAMRQNEIAKRILRQVGLEEERLGLEWISASEGNRFANICNAFYQKIKKLGPTPLTKPPDIHPPSDLDLKNIKEIMKKTKAYLCFDCGKCTPVCPINKHFPQFSPRRVISNLVLNDNINILKSSVLWKCLTCRKCNYVCLTGVDFPEFVRSIREYLYKTKNSIPTFCHGGVMNTIAQITSNENIKQKRTDWIDGEIMTAKDSEYIYFTGCLPYFTNVYYELNYDFTEIAKSSIKLLNEIGIIPEVLEEERCCGHDQWIAGDVETFKRLASINSKIINNTKAKFIVASCPECVYVLKEIYKKIGAPIAKEVKHISQILAEEIEKLQNRIFENKVTYQDPCRLGRYLGIYQEPRKIINAFTNGNFVEMGNNSEMSTCCGASAFLNCDQANKKNQMERLEEARATNAKTILTSCPKCLVHWHCAMKDENFRNHIKINVEDISVALRNAIREPLMMKR